MAKQTIRLYLFLSVLSDFGISFIAAFHVIYLMVHGLNLFEVNMVNSVCFLTGFIFEVPTGAIADIYGRKVSFLLAMMFKSLSLALYAFSNCFWQFCVAEAVYAIGFTFYSGAFQAWLVDRLKQLEYEGENVDIFARRQKYSSLAKVIGAPLGGYIAVYSYALPWLIGSFVMFSAGVIALFLMKEEGFERKNIRLLEQIVAVREKISLSFSYTLKNQVVRDVAVISGVFIAAIQAANMQWQPLFISFGMDELELGFLFAGISVALFVGAHFAPFLLRWKGSERCCLLFLLIIVAIGILLTPIMPWIWVAILTFIVHEAGRGGIAPIIDEYLHKNIPSEERATICSINSMVRFMAGVCGLILSGVMANYISISFAWIVSGAFLLVATLYLRKRK